MLTAWTGVNVSNL
jgi:hypothetical protein